MPKPAAPHTIAGTAFTQTYSTTATTVPAATVVTVATDAASTSAHGFTEAQANAIPVAVNALAADVLALRKVINAMIDEMQHAGMVD